MANSIPKFFERRYKESISSELLLETVMPKPISFTPISLRSMSVRNPLSKPPALPLNSSFLHDSPSILILIPMFGNFSASFMTLSSNHPDVEITTRGDFRNITSTISSRSSRTNGSPPVRFTNFTLGSFSSSFTCISLLFSVGFCHILHILHCIGHL